MAGKSVLELIMGEGRNPLREFKNQMNTLIKEDDGGRTLAGI